MMNPLPRSKPPIFLTALSLTLLQACNAETSRPTTTCGVLYRYDKKTEEQAAKEYQAMRTASTFPVSRELIDDYKETRQSIRDCGQK
jgi:hypothetical protein